MIKSFSKKIVNFGLSKRFIHHRFWKEVIVKNIDNQTQTILLDSHPLKDSEGQNFIVKDSPLLASLLALEWQRVGLNFDPNSDLLLNSIVDRGNIIERHPKTKLAIANSLIPFYQTDTIRFFAENGKLAELQLEKWSPIIIWASDFLKIQIKWFTGIEGFKKPDEIEIAALTNYLNTFSPRRLAGNKQSSSWNVAFERAVLGSKSFLLTMALAQNQISVGEAQKLALLEVNYQTNEWGRIEESHDMEDALLGKLLSLSTVIFNTQT